MLRFVALLLFILIVQAVSWALGIMFGPGEWYASLNKPWFQPDPKWFGLVWPVLYLLVAIAGWKVFIGGGDRPGWGAWVAQMALNWAWVPLFFGAHMIFWAMVVLGANLLTALAFVGATWNRDKLASLCFVPYCAWLVYALPLNIAIWSLN